MAAFFLHHRSRVAVIATTQKIVVNGFQIMKTIHPGGNQSAKTRNATESDDRMAEANLSAKVESLNSSILEGYF